MGIERRAGLVCGFVTDFSAGAWRDGFGTAGLRRGRDASGLFQSARSRLAGLQEKEWREARP